MSGIPLIARATGHGDRTAIVATEGVFSYRDLLDASVAFASRLLDGADDLGEKRVAFLVPPGFQYAAVQWGIWRAGGVAVPLAVSHPRPELEYAIEDSGASAVVVHPVFANALKAIAADRKLRFLLAGAGPDGGGSGRFDSRSATPGCRLPHVEDRRRALMLYTSGTTSKPKGVVTTHRNIEAQVVSLVAAWEWRGDDRILHVLPLHHIHGVINVLTCALWSGAACEILPKFYAEKVWARFIEGGLTLFMAVPTIYVKLIAAWRSASPERQRAMSEACTKMRLMVSGSAALPSSTLEEWRKISGHVLLERYGMTETGMTISNPLRGRRAPGCVGAPLPGVEVRLVDDAGKPAGPGTPGEIQVRGPGVFLEYWSRPEATEKAFDGGWFRTGDSAVLDGGIYRILGRNSVDIIKTGGYKVSALEIEEALLAHPCIDECAVVGVDDPEWGERVCGALVLKPGARLTLEDLRDWAKRRLAPYKVPSRIVTLDALPRNAMGKVAKPEVKTAFLSSEGTSG